VYPGIKANDITKPRKFQAIKSRDNQKCVVAPMNVAKWKNKIKREDMVVVIDSTEM
jgi:hypothetical protein